MLNNFKHKYYFRYSKLQIVRIFVNRLQTSFEQPNQKTATSAKLTVYKPSKKFDGFIFFYLLITSTVQPKF